MLKKVATLCSELKMTIVSGVFFLLSLILLILKSVLGLEISPYLDPIWITIIISGYPLVYSAFFKLFKKKQISSALLITIAMIASLIIGEVFAAGEIAFIMAIGEILEDITVDKAKEGLNKLISLTPSVARVIDKEIEVMIETKDIKIGMVIRVLPGESIPVDGRIIKGSTSIDQRVITGESLPVDKTTGDLVFTGTTNCYGSIDIEVLKTQEDSSLQKMIKLVEDAENKKAPTERIADKWAGWLVPVALVIAIVVGIVVNSIIGNDDNQALIRAVTILVVFCPCALALATPTSVMAGIGQATKYGVIIKSGEVIEEMGKIDCIAFDKTGTLTYGNLEVSDLLSFNNVSNDKVLSIASSIEKYSEHPLACAICGYASENNSNIYEVNDFKMIPGLGVSGIINDDIHYCGNLKYIESLNISIDDNIYKSIDNLRNEGKAVVIVSNKNNIIGVIALSDVIRPEAKEIVRKLKKMNIDVVLLTGDHYTTANYFANQVGIDNIKAELLPEDKICEIKKLQKNGKKVAMIGDGVNDAGALKTANVGIAMGSIGSDITVEASGISLISDDIKKVPYLVQLSKSTFNTIKFNIITSMTLNIIAIILSTIGVLNPITGALFHNAGSVIVVLNAALVYNRNYLKKVKKI